MACVEVQREVSSGITAFVPAINLALVRTQSCGDRFFGGVKVGPGGSSGDVALVIEAFAQLVVGAADVLVQRMAAALFVASEIVAIAGGGTIFAIARLRVAGWRGCGRFTARGATVRRNGLARGKRER